ncbi:short-chain dehydrogenase [Oceanobacillus damuensis]|uniref:short-chain dehydrogenase n=1 Tax=Oceanobacillus damuensis TaxID=937928 RepID=UPI0008319EBD|nr:short-chain dehydrogenase [Oceanobacillus damuensis]
MQHALVVGGTGMLAEATMYLVNQGYFVSVIARSQTRMWRLINAAKDRSMIIPLYVDYRNESELKEAVRKTILQNGNINLVIAWIHSVAENALEIISDEVASIETSWDLFHIVGSSNDLNHMKRKAEVPVNCIYHQVQLGFVIEGTKSRWLTHKEISEGVIKAIKERRLLHIVGTLEPWERRP